MSLLVTAVGLEGLAISVDSAMALTLTAGDLLARQGFDVDPATGPHLATPFNDVDTKIAAVHGRFLLALAGAVPGAMGAAALAALVTHPAVAAATDPDAITGAVRQGVADLIAAHPVAPEGAAAELGVAVLVAYRRTDGVSCIDVVTGAPSSSPLNWDARVGQRACGRFLVGCQALVGPMLDQIELPVAHWPLPLAARFTRFAVQLAIDAQQFVPGLRLVGRAILTGVLDADGARIVAPRSLVVPECGLAAA